MGGFEHLHFILIDERTEEKYVAEELTAPLAHSFNSSSRSGVMPTLWKSTPVHKGDKMEVVQNYRFTSLMPIPAKYYCIRCYM